MDRYDLLGWSLGLAALANAVLAAANFLRPDGVLSFALSEAAGAVMLGIIALQVSVGHEHTDWEASPFGEHGPEIVAAVVGLAGILLLGVGLDRLL